MAGRSGATRRFSTEPDEETPELSDDELAKGVLREGERVIRRGPGRPRSASAKAQVTLRLDPKVLAYFRATGAGWQTRINRVLALAAQRGARKIERARSATPRRKRPARLRSRRPKG